MQKLEIPRLRLSPQLETELKEAAGVWQRSASELLEEIVREWLDRHQEPEEVDPSREEERQRQLHAAAARFIGSIEGEDPDRAENASFRVREKLLRRHAR